MPDIQISVVLAVIVNKKGEVFLTQRNDPETSEHMKWEFPGGKIHFGETPEYAVVREVKEETGFDIEITRLLPKVYENVYEPNHAHPFSRYHVVLISYECRVIAGEFKPLASETLQGKFFERDKIDYSQCLKYQKEIIELLDK